MGIKYERVCAAVKKVQGRWELKVAVNDNPFGIPAAPIADIQLRIIGPGRVFSNQYGVLFTTPPMYQLTGLRTTDPLLRAIGRREITVGRLSPFEDDIWALFPDPR